MKTIGVLSIILLVVGIGAAQAEDVCHKLSVSPESKLTIGKDVPKETDSIWVILPGGIAHPEWHATKGAIALKTQTVTALQTELNAVSAADRPAVRLDLRDAHNISLGQRCPDFGAPAAANTPADPATPAPAPATRLTVVAAAAAAAAQGGAGGGSANQVSPMQPVDCERLAGAELANSPSHNKYIVFNTLGQLCFASTTIAQGDLLHIAIAVRANQDFMILPQSNIQTCSLRSATPTIYGDASKIPKAAYQGQGTYDADQLVLLTTRRCFDDQLTVTVQTSADGKAGPATQIQQYKRYQAGVYLGVVYTDLRDGDFGLRSFGSTSVIFDKDPQKRGPTYNASVVVYGVGRYIQQGLDYTGRDLVNNNQPLDRLGFVFSTGLQDAGKRFGLGLSYELIRGINLQFLYEWVNTKQLAGYSVGDTFTGTADQIPTRNEWNHTTSLGVSLDLAYVTQLFTKN